LPPILQWNGGAASDEYFVRVVSSTFELDEFTTATHAPASRVPLDATTWQQLTDSTSGAATLTVTRWDGAHATQIASHTWTIAPASMRGTVYYWSNDLGRVLRIAPGAPAPDDFAGPSLSNPTMYPPQGCLMACHTVSANGSTIVSGGATFAGSYNLETDTPLYDLGPWGGPPSASWMMAAVSPDGKYVLTNSMAEAYATSVLMVTPPPLGLYAVSNGQPVSSSGIANVPVAEPTWSPDGSRVLFVDPGDPMSTTAPWSTAWNDPPPGDLKSYAFNASSSPMFFGEQTLVATGSDPNARITWPTVTPDGQWVLYSRSAGADTRELPVATDGSGPGALYFASATTPTSTPAQEVRLANVDGDGYPFAAGARDVGWNFEPSFAPVAAGGYFWVVFTSRRTYGNILTGPALPCSSFPQCANDPACATDSCASSCACTTATEVKQLWIAAIDQNPKPGVDPSHPAFHLTGQDESNLAMRAFYALPPCKGDGQSCASGTDCCGGFCESGSDGGAGSCSSTVTGCSATGDKCTVDSDCCSAASGVTCIAHVCSEPTPQ
jgi:hypothetical protein